MARKKANKSEAKIVHTKRRQVEDGDGWTHIIDSPRKKAVPKPAAFHGGDFEIDGVSYINRTLAEMRAEFEHWKKSWEESDACKILRELLQGKKAGNAVVLGLGSLQSSRREGRRASATQLAALQTVVEISGAADVVLQDPQYTELDRQFLSSLGYNVVDDPDAFKAIRTDSLVYAIHCYRPVYNSISEGLRPSVLIGTDVENFGRFDASNDGIKESLEKLVKDCQTLDFPQVRHDFSDTKIYVRKFLDS